MKYDELSRSALDAQIERIEKTRAKISARDMVVSPGRVIPDDADLAIGTGRRLDAAVLFIDISGFSAWLSNTLKEQERILRVRSFFFSKMIAIVEDYGGQVEKNTGNSPALNAVLGGCTAIDPQALEALDCPFAPALGVTVGPGEEQYDALDCGPYTPEQLDDVLKRTKRLVVIATAKYEDQFNQQHQSRACFEYSPGDGRWVSCAGIRDTAN